jgi:hypothetical protein
MQPNYQKISLIKQMGNMTTRKSVPGYDNMTITMMITKMIMWRTTIMIMGY